MSEKASGCFGCLGTIVCFVFIGSILFGVAGITVKIGNIGFSLGNLSYTSQQQDNNTVNVTNLESKTKAVEEAVKQFHTQLEQGKCKEIYNQASELLKQTNSQVDLVTYCDQIRREFGTLKSTERLDFWGPLANQDAEKYVLVHYYTTFSNSSAQETFVWLVKDNKTQLVRYEFHSINPAQNAPINEKRI